MASAAGLSQRIWFRNNLSVDGAAIRNSTTNQISQTTVPGIRNPASPRTKPMPESAEATSFRMTAIKKSRILGVRASREKSCLILLGLELPLLLVPVVELGIFYAALNLDFVQAGIRVKVTQANERLILFCTAAPSIQRRYRLSAVQGSSERPESGIETRPGAARSKPKTP